MSPDEQTVPTVEVAQMNRAARRALGRQSAVYRAYRKRTRPFRRAFGSRFKGLSGVTVPKEYGE